VREAQKKAAEVTEAAGLVPSFSERKKQPSTDEVSNEHTKNVISMTQWLNIFSIFVSIVGIYYKR